MDEARVEAAGLDGLRDQLARIHGLGDKAAIAGAVRGSVAALGPHPVRISTSRRTSTRPRAMSRIWGRAGSACRIAIIISRTIRISRPSATAYRDHIVRLLTLAGEPAAEASADAIIALETALARLQWTRVENRDPIKTYNKTEVAGLPALLAPSDWPAYLAAAGVGARHPYPGRGAAELLRRPRRGVARHAAGKLARLARLQSAQRLRALSCRRLRRRGFRLRAAHAARRAGNAAALEARGGAASTACSALRSAGSMSNATFRRPTRRAPRR